MSHSLDLHLWSGLASASRKLIISMLKKQNTSDALFQTQYYMKWYNSSKIVTFFCNNEYVPSMIVFFREMNVTFTQYSRLLILSLEISYIWFHYFRRMISFQYKIT